MYVLERIFENVIRNLIRLVLSIIKENSVAELMIWFFITLRELRESFKPIA